MPFAKGLSSYSDGASHGVADPQILIDEDLGYRKEIPVNHFVEHVLCWSLGDCIDHRIQEELRHATETRELLDEFCSQADQRSRHEPFASLANRFLNYRKASGLTFCRNDPRLIQGSVAEHTPDLVLVSTKSPQLEYGAELPRGPAVGFYWDDVYCSVEFKVRVTEPKKEAEAVMSASHSLPVRSHGYTGGTADLHMRSMSNEDSWKRAAGSPPSGQPQAKKSDHRADHSEERRPSAFYVLEMLSHGQYRSHVINITIQDTSMRLWFYDRVGVIMSAAFSVLDLALFGRVMFAMGSLSPNGRGFHDFISDGSFTHVRPQPTGSRHSQRQMNKPAPPPMFDHESKAPRATTSSEPFTGTVIRFHNGVIVTLREIVYRQYALIGRGTCVIRGEVKGHSDLSGKDLMVKISWPSRWRTSESDFTQVIVDVVKCHRALHEGPKILHRDISMNNIMFCRGENNRVIGVLIDFDLAVFVEVDPQSGSLHLDRRFRTGTLPFMAIDLLEGKDKIHWVRHDLESILWVTVWYTARYHEGVETTRAFQVWRKTDMPTLAEKKAFFLDTTELYEPTALFGGVTVWVFPLMDLFHSARHARVLQTRANYAGGQTSDTLDPETLGGRITYQTFLHTLGEE